MAKTKIGIVGLGWVAQVVHIPIFMKHSEAEVVAVCDTDKNRASLVAEKIGLRRGYSHIQDLLENEDVDAIVVCTSTDAHREITIAALQAGKDVLVEKPIARTFDEALEMAEVARSTNRKLMVGMNHRFRPDMMILKSFIEGKELGKLYQAKAGWIRTWKSQAAWKMDRSLSGGGVFLDLGVVMLDVSLWLLGYPNVERVSAGNFNVHNKNVEDASVVTMYLEGNSVLTIEVGWSGFVDQDSYYCNISGTEGSASLNPLQIYKELHGNLVNLAPAKTEPHQNMFKRSYENEIKHFLSAVRNVLPIVSTGEEAVHRMRIVDAVYRSAKIGKEISLS